MNLKVFLSLRVLVGLIVMGAILYLVCSTARSFLTTEGFVSKIVATPKCPAGARFFNDSKGDSFCCRGSVDPYKHTCSATGVNDLCAHKAGARDPRNPQRVLPDCASLIEREHSEDQSKFCPTSLPHYGSIGKCCQSGTDMDNNDCIAFDNKDATRYCKLSGPLAPGEQLCSDVKLYETAKCPSGLERIMFTPAGQNARRLPACFSVQRNCIPDNVIEQAKADGIGALKDVPANWEFSCNQYDKVYVRRDLT